MEAIIIESGEDTPEIIFDPLNNKFELLGNSLPEDANSFFEPLIDWIDSYAENPNEETIVHFKMDYFNTASSKKILGVLFAFEQILNKDKRVVIHWHYLDEDEDMREAGMDYSEMVEVPFEFFSYSDDD